MTQDLEKKCKAAARAIRAGSLVVDKIYSQIPRYTHKQLALMNDLGFLTTDSQVGTKNERAYVCGFLHETRAKPFVNYLNAHSNFVAFMPVQSNKRSPIMVTRSSEGKGCTWCPIGMEQREFVHLAEGLTGVSLIECFDPEWGRNAKTALFPSVINALKMLEGGTTTTMPVDTSKIK